MEANGQSHPRTCAKNATTHPGEIVLQAQGKRRTKEEVTADDKQKLADKAAQDKSKKDSIARLARMQIEMEARQGATEQVTPVRPCPRPRIKGQPQLQATRAEASVSSKVSTIEMSSMMFEL